MTRVAILWLENGSSTKTDARERERDSSEMIQGICHHWTPTIIPFDELIMHCSGKNPKLWQLLLLGCIGDKLRQWRHRWEAPPRISTAIKLIITGSDHNMYMEMWSNDFLHSRSSFSPNTASKSNPLDGCGDFRDGVDSDVTCLWGEPLMGLGIPGRPKPCPCCRWQQLQSSSLGWCQCRWWESWRGEPWKLRTRWGVAPEPDACDTDN